MACSTEDQAILQGNSMAWKLLVSWRSGIITERNFHGKENAVRMKNRMRKNPDALTVQLKEFLDPFLEA
jgi:hypothetical protein